MVKGSPKDERFSLLFQPATAACTHYTACHPFLFRDGHCQADKWGWRVSIEKTINCRQISSSTSSTLSVNRCEDLTNRRLQSEVVATSSLTQGAGWPEVVVVVVVATFGLPGMRRVHRVHWAHWDSLTQAATGQELSSLITETHTGCKTGARSIVL